MNSAAEIIPINIEDEMKGSYLDYAMSVIIGRALPDVRDGLKPAHRRILYAMYREGILSNKRFSKCAGVVGEVLKKYHPHGDAAVYDTLVRMAQDWNMRYPLIDGQGNFGSIDGDSAAAYRYTEARLKAIAEELLADIDKETVDFTPNFDETTVEPVVLPSKIPNLLVNGSDGIAVGMATKIPPHNLGEVVDGLVALIDDPALTVKDLMKHVPGPDFPTGAAIHGRDGIKSAYETGRGQVVLRAKAMIEPMARGDRESIVVTEIPYQVNKARLIERIAELTRDGKIDGISDIRDESDRDGMRIVVELKRGVVAGVVLNQLYTHTSLQTSVGIIMLAIVAGQPRTLSLKDALSLFIDHRREVVTRRTAFDLAKAEERAHILEGLRIAIENIDEVVALIKKSKEPAAARDALMKRYKLSERQAQAILDLRLQRLTGLERDKIISEYKEVIELIKELRAILADEKRVMRIIREELMEVRGKYADGRRTEIKGKAEELSVEDLIQEEEMVITVSHRGYIKRNPISIYRAQRRGGRGKQGMVTREEDFVENLFIASTHSYVLIFTSTGRVFWVKVHEIPQVGRVARGQAITNLVNMSGEERIAAVLPVREFSEGQFVVMATRNGVIKKTDLMAYANPRAGGIIALSIDKGDELISVRLTNGSQHLFLTTRSGQSLRCEEGDVRAMGRTARGVRGMSLRKGDELVGMEALAIDSPVLTVTERGYGKRSDLSEYRVQSRGGSGILTIKVADKNGPVVGALQVTDADDVMIVTDGGKVIRSGAKEIPVIGRNTQGVRLISLEKDEKVVTVAKVVEDEGEVAE
ncbi:MAG: DNA gyrase subunit A [Proteobacteria bacterium]|nr:DNA gyrase subunit A [Pseudomonadota bacterium]